MASATVDQILTHADTYRTLIAKHLAELPPAAPIRDTLTTVSDQESRREITVCLRTRPLLPHELEKEQFASVAVRNPDTWLMKPEFKWNGPVVTSQRFGVDMSFGPEDDTDVVYEATAKNLLPLVLGGGVAQLFAYGQTGSGKTYTMTGLEERFARDLFTKAHEFRVANPGADKNAIANEPDNVAGFKFYLSFFELIGNETSDLLNNRAPVRILEDRFGNVQYQGILEETITSADQFLDLIRRAASLRHTESTFKNEASSRSHAVCHLRSVNLCLPQAEDGHLFVIDLAGSENSADSLHHDRARLAETREINKSLMTLKECIRNRALAIVQQERYVHIPYRASKLTTVLKDAFELTAARQCCTIVIAHISPNVLDSAHSTNTLRYAGPIKVAAPTGPRKVDPDDPVMWSNEQMHKWIKATSKLVPPEVLCPTETGLQLCKLTEAEFMTRCLSCKGMSEKKAKTFYVKLWELVIDARTKQRREKLMVRNIQEENETEVEILERNIKAEEAGKSKEELEQEAKAREERYLKMDQMMAEHKARRNREAKDRMQKAKERRQKEEEERAKEAKEAEEEEEEAKKAEEDVVAEV